MQDSPEKKVMSSVSTSESQWTKTWTNHNKSQWSHKSPETAEKQPQELIFQHRYKTYGMLQIAVLELIKVTLSTVLNGITQWLDICIGCKILAPNKMEHSCLSPLDKYYFF